MKQEQKTHVSADALIQLLKGAKAIRWQLALGVVMSLALVVCALIIPTQMGALVQILIDYFDAPETGASVLAQLAPGLLALAGVYLLRAAISYGKMQLLNRAVSRYLPAICASRSPTKSSACPSALSITRPSAIFSRA